MSTIRNTTKVTRDALCAGYFHKFPHSTMAQVWNKEPGGRFAVRETGRQRCIYGTPSFEVTARTRTSILTHICTQDRTGKDRREERTASLAIRITMLWGLPVLVRCSVCEASREAPWWALSTSREKRSLSTTFSLPTWHDVVSATSLEWLVY